MHLKRWSVGVNLVNASSVVPADGQSTAVDQCVAQSVADWRPFTTCTNLHNAVFLARFSIQVVGENSSHRPPILGATRKHNGDAVLRALCCEHSNPSDLRKGEK